MTGKKIITALLTGFASLSLMAQEEAAELSPRVYLVSNAHFDSQWRWTVQQSISEFLPNTMLQNFKLFEEFPDYVFNFEGACKYAWMKEYYPDLFEKVKHYVALDRWHLSGSSWDASDTNVPSVESAFRNIRLAQEFFKAEFGCKSTDIMLPDCFGFSWTMPSVAAHCGIIGFSTQKLSWRHKPLDGVGRKYPFEFGRWRGVDGSEILAAMNGGGYGWNPREDLVNNPELQAKIDDSAVKAAYRYFGTRSSELRGDRGGSALPRTVRHIETSLKKDGPYRLLMTASDQIYKDYSGMVDRLPVFDGELLMDVHATGCYTSNAWMKTLNRRNEQLAYSAEAAGVMADWAGLLDYPHYVLTDASRRFIWHQFHDDLPGTSIPEAYKFSYNDELIAQNQFAGVIESSVSVMASTMDTDVRGIPVVVYNPVSVRNVEAVKMEVTLPEGYEDVAVYDAKGARVRSQILGRNGRKATLAFASDMLPLSLSVYDLRYLRKASGKRSSSLVVTGRTIENGVYRITLDENGDMSSVFDKRTGKELVREGRSFGLSVFEENTSDRWPSWEILKSVLDKEPVPVKEQVRIIPEQSGELMAVLRVERKYGNSTFVQRVCLTDGACDDRIDVLNDVNWHSERTLLKASFPVAFDSSEAVYDLGLGQIRRGNNTPASYEVCAYQWVDMTAPDSSYGVCLMSDSKYGWDKPDNGTVRLSLIHTPTADGGWFPHEKTQDIGPHSFVWSICAHKGPVQASEMSSRADMQNTGKMAFISEKHKGSRGKTFSFASSSSESLMIKSVSKASDNDGYIVRLYEMNGSDSEGSVSFPSEILSAESVNGIGEYAAPASFSGNTLAVSAGRFSPVTYRVRLKTPAPKMPVEEYSSIKLPYNKMAITSDAFCAVGQMDSDWNSYAAEMIPDTLVCRGVPFTFAREDYANSVRCEGQKVKVPEGCSRVYMLAASTAEGTDAAFSVAGKQTVRHIPYWSGFFGQCGWYGHIKPYLREADIAYVGTHRHNPKMRNEPYTFTYMYMIYVPVDGETEIVLPKEGDLMIFSATAVKGRRAGIEAASRLVTEVR